MTNDSILWGIPCLLTNDNVGVDIYGNTMRLSGYDYRPITCRLGLLQVCRMNSEEVARGWTSSTSLDS